MGIVSIIVIGLIGLAIGLFIMFKLLDKSNNFGDSKASAEEVSLGGFIMYNQMNRLDFEPRLDDIQNPKYEGPGLEDSFQKQEKMAGISLEKQLNSTDLSGIKWHD